MPSASRGISTTHPSSRSPAAFIPWKCVTARSAAIRRTRRATRKRRRLPTRWTSSAARDRATSSCSCPGSARSAMPPIRSGATACATPRSCRFMHAFRRPSRTGYSSRPARGAVDETNTLSAIGAELARLPLDPRVGRMLVAARDEGCVAQVRLIAAALSVQDPRERPLDQAAAADERHARFAHERSDFLGLLKLAALFENKMEKACRENFLSVPRMREWRDVAGQLERTLRELGWEETSVNADTTEGYRAIHRALTAGLLGNIGMRNEPEGSYSGARGITFWVHPGSSVKKPGRWAAAAELVETTRLFARTVAAIEPRSLEEIGAHLITREHYAPQWDARRGEVVAF